MVRPVLRLIDMAEHDCRCAAQAQLVGGFHYFQPLRGGDFIGADHRAHVVIEGGAQLGEHCVVHPHAFLGRAVTVGNQSILGASCVVGGIGFGFGFGQRGAVRLHHLGRVEIGDRTEVGSGATIDRARFGVTRIGNDVKIDSQVHIGHNCSVGDGTILAAQVGMAGSADVGSRCLLGGQAGISGHLSIADGTMIAAKAGIARTLSKPGKYFGYVAKESVQAMRELAAIGKLPAALRELRALQAEVEELRKKLDN